MANTKAWDRTERTYLSSVIFDQIGEWPSSASLRLQLFQPIHDSEQRDERHCTHIGILGTEVEPASTLLNGAPTNVDRVKAKCTVGSIGGLKTKGIIVLIESVNPDVRAKELDIELFVEGNGNRWHSVQTRQSFLE